MKRLILSVVMTGVLGLAAFSLSNAQQSGDSPRGRGPGGPGGFGRGGVAALRGLDLTDEQKASIMAIHDEQRQARTGPPADAALRRDLEAEVFAESPDAQKIAQVLTPEQRAKIRERLAQAPSEPRRPPPQGKGAQR